MIIILKEFNNGLFDCIEADSDSNKKLKEKSTGFIYNNPVIIPKDRLNDFEETEIEKDKAPEEQKEIKQEEE